MAKRRGTGKGQLAPMAKQRASRSTGAACSLPRAWSLPAAPIKHLVVTPFGKPFSVAGLGNRMRKWCDEAGLEDRSMHGLRKAVARRVAESGGTDAEGQAVTGHRKAETFMHYRARANRSTLADVAMSNVASTFDIQPDNEAE